MKIILSKPELKSLGFIQVPPTLDNEFQFVSKKLISTYNFDSKELTMSVVKTHKTFQIPTATGLELNDDVVFSVAILKKVIDLLK